MKRIYSIILAVAALLVLSACDRYYDGYYDDEYYESSTNFLTLRNFSSDTTVWFIPEKAYAESLPAELSEWQRISIFELWPHSSEILSFDSGDNYETPLETYGVADRFTIYIFKKSVWESYTWQDIVNGKMWCGKCSLTVDDAVAQKRVVSYPIR